MTSHQHTIEPLVVVSAGPPPFVTNMTAIPTTGQTGPSVTVLVEGFQAVSTQSSTVTPSLVTTMINQVAGQFNKYRNLASPEHILSQNVWST